MRHLFFAATLAAVLPFAGLPGQFERIAPAAKGRVGVAAQLLESGETADLHGEEHFPMHSVYKLPISMAVLQRVDRGELKLDQKVKVKPSDFVRTGMYSPVRDKYQDGTELTVAELLILGRLFDASLGRGPMLDREGVREALNTGRVGPLGGVR